MTTHARRIAAGLCAECAQPPLATKTRCESCRQAHNENARIKRSVPCECGAPRVTGGRHCAACRDRRWGEARTRTLHRLSEMRRARVDAGLCAQCGAEPLVSGFRGERCLGRTRKAAA